MTSLQHGMQSKKMAMRREDSYAFENRLRKWTAPLDPHGDIGEFLVYRTGVAPIAASPRSSRRTGEQENRWESRHRRDRTACDRTFIPRVSTPIAASPRWSRRTGGNRGFASTERHAVGRLFGAFLPPKPPTVLLVVGLGIDDHLYSRDRKLHRLPARLRPGHSDGHRRLLLSRRAVTLKKAVTSQVISLSLTDLSRSRNLGVNLGGGFQRRRASRL